MIITNLEDGGKLATYEGVEDKPAVEALESEGLVQPSRYDKINWITSKRCIRPTWSVILEEGKKPRVYRLRKEALRRVKEIEGDIPLLAIEFQKDGQAIQQPVVISDSLDLNEYVVYLPFNTTDEKKISEWISSNPELISVTNGIVTVVEASDDPVTITAIAKEGIEASISVKGEVEVLANPTINFGPTGLVTLACPTEGATIYYTTDGSDPTSGSVYSTPFQVTNGTTVKAVAKKGDVYSDAVSDTFTLVVSSPVIDIVESTGVVSITCDTDNSEIYYTIDGSTPSKSSTKYTDSFTLENSATVKAIAYVDTAESTVSSASWVKPEPGKVNAPTFTPSAGTINYGTGISIACSTDGATIKYSIDGSDPSITYSTPIVLEESATIKAIATKDGLTNSDVVSAAYTISFPTVATPTISPAAGAIYANETEISISCTTDGAEIHYTDDGTVPTSSSPVYSTAFTISEAKTIKAIAIKDHYNDSEVASVAYTIKKHKVETPTFTPNGGNVSKNDTMTMNCSTEGAVIHYTDDGSAPTSESPVYSGAITITATTTLKAIAVKDGWDDSSVKSATFTVVLPTVATPTFSPAAGVVNKGSTVSINCTTEGASILYSVDGSDPSLLYSTPIAINSNTTIKAKATLTDYNDSEVASATYTVPQVATPVIQPSETSHEGSVEVSITCEAGATIHYTDDGSNPDENSTTYSSPITITATSSDVTKTIKAIAVKSGSLDSEVASKTYTVTKPAAVLYKYYGLRDMVDDGEGDTDPAYIITQANIASTITSLSWIESNLYNAAGGFKTVASDRQIGTDSEQAPITARVADDVGIQVVYIYPAKYGELETLKEKVNDMSNSFYHTTLTLDDNVDYIVYWLKNPTGDDGYSSTFYFA